MLRMRIAASSLMTLMCSTSRTMSDVCVCSSSTTSCLSTCASIRYMNGSSIGRGEQQGRRRRKRHAATCWGDAVLVPLSRMSWTMIPQSLLPSVVAKLTPSYDWQKRRGERMYRKLRCMNSGQGSREIETQKRKRHQKYAISNPRKMRLDEAVSIDHPGVSKQVIRSWILTGKVSVNGKPVSKAGHMVRKLVQIDTVEDDDISNDGDDNANENRSDIDSIDNESTKSGRVKESVISYRGVSMPRYVCRAGDKLAAAINQMDVDVRGKVVLDSGISTGGFTDCLLQHGASRVYGIDVGYGQVAEKIRQDDRVIILERTNLRHITANTLPEKVNLITLDLSFISILKVIPAIVTVASNDCDLITLIKPQFEAGRSQVGAGGIVRDDNVRMKVLNDVCSGIMNNSNFTLRRWIESPVHGATGNREFLAHFTSVKEALK